MAEIQLTRIKSLYGEIKGYLDSIDGSNASGPYIVPRAIAEKFNQAVDDLSRVSGSDYSRSKIPDSEMRGMMNYRVVKAQMSAIATRLENEFDFTNKNKSNPGIVILNENSNKIIQTNYTISTLITQQEDDTAKQKLEELNMELSKSDKKWESIKKIIIWIANFSKELFLQVIPIILEKKL